MSEGPHPSAGAVGRDETLAVSVAAGGGAGRRVGVIGWGVRVRPVLALLAGLLPGCDETRVVSEAGAFELGFAGLHSEAWVAWEPPYRVVPGTRLCPAVRCAACEADDSCAGVVVAASGPVHAEGACFVADAPGVSEWRVGAPCDEQDRARITVVAAETVVAAARPWTDRAATAAELATQGGTFAAELSTPLRVVAGSQLRLDVGLYDRADGHVVGWSDGAVQVVATRGRAPVVYPGEALELVVFADTAAKASFTVGAATWPIGPVVGVPESDARSLAVAVMLAPGEGGATPAIARAEVRDEQGRLLLGMPVTWSVSAGSLALTVDRGLPGPEWVAIADACVPPEARGGPRTATIRAEAGGLAGQLGLRWSGVAGAEDPEFVPAERCAEAAGCGCHSRAGGGWGGLLLLLGLRRRRR